MYHIIFKSFISIKPLLCALLITGILFYPAGHLIEYYKLVNYFNLYDSQKIDYAINFMTWAIVCLYYVLLLKSINNILLLSVVVVTPSLALGAWLLSNNLTNVTDIFADATRFVAPFLSYAGAFYLLSRCSHDNIIKLFVLLFAHNLYTLVNSIIIKLEDTGPFIGYNTVTVESSPMLITVFVFFYLFRKNKSITLLIFSIISLLCFVLSPFMQVSKTGYIHLSFQLIVLMYFFFSHVKLQMNKLIMVIASIILATIFISNFNDSDISKRFHHALSVFDVVKDNDASTTARIGEIEGVIENFINSPMTLFFGVGSGAWITSYHVDKYRTTIHAEDSGLLSANYRNNGKHIHNIHSGVFSVLNRNGFFGIMAYLLLIYFALKLIIRLIKYSVNKYPHYTDEQLFVYLFAVGSAINAVGTIFISPIILGLYGDFGFGLNLAIISVAFKYLTNTPSKAPINKY